MFKIIILKANVMLGSGMEPVTVGRIVRSVDVLVNISVAESFTCYAMLTVRVST